MTNESDYWFKQTHDGYDIDEFYGDDDNPYEPDFDDNERDE